MFARSRTYPELVRPKRVTDQPLTALSPGRRIQPADPVHSEFGAPDDTTTKEEALRRSPLFFALAAIFVCSRAAAQTTGDISGRVTDTSGMPLPDVTIEATGPSLQGPRVTVTGRDGWYRIPAIPPGPYRVVATLSGSRAAEKNVGVSLGAVMSVNLTLRMETEERIVVEGKTPLIDTTSTTTGTNYSRDIIDRLPVGRNYADIVRSNPGVSTDVGDAEGRFLSLAIYGATSAENQWIVDGVNTTSVHKGTQGKALSNEFVQEVEVKAGGFQAEYGRALGGVINVITKSGGNTFHGDGFVYYDSTDTAARRRFNSEDSELATMRVVDGKRLDYGAALGGYLLRDRLWFFAAYNRVGQDGDLSRVAASAHVSKDELFPFDGVDNLYSGKITWNAVSSTTVVGTVFADPSSTSGAAGADPRQGLGIYVRPIVSPDPSTWYSARTQGGTDYGIRLTQLFGSRALATFQGAYHRDRNDLDAADGIRYMDQNCVGGTQAQPCSFPAEFNAIYGGYGAMSASESSRKQYSAGVTVFAGQHDLKAGGDYLDGVTNVTNRFSGGQQVWLRNEFGQSYYFHRYFAVSPTDPTPVAADYRRAQVLDYGAYLQDSWKPGQGLTVNAGLRWDGEVVRDYFGDSILRFNELQPRLGVAWDPWRNGRTKLYASAGRFSSALPTTGTAFTFGKLSSLGVSNFDPVSVVQDPNVFRHGRRQGGGGLFAEAVDEGVKAPYQDELTVGVERLLSPTTTVGLKGTYRRLGRALEDRCDLDYSRPETGFADCALINPGSNGRFASGNVPICDGLYDAPAGNQCSSTGPATPEAKRLYRGLEVFARHAVGDRLWLQASYSYSSLRGNYDGGVNEGIYDQNLGSTTPSFDYDFNNSAFWHNSYGVLTLDRPSRFRFDGYWVTPLRLSVGIQAFVESGAPLNRLGYMSAYGPIVFLVPRGSAGRLPTLWDANMTLSYPIALGPATLTLQAYLFNLFDNQIPTAKDQAWTTSPPEDFPATIYDPNQPQNNPSYGKVTARSSPRSFRAAARLTF